MKIIGKYAAVFTIVVMAGMALMCSLEKPTAVDGGFSLKIVAIDTSGTLLPNADSDSVRVAGARVRIKSTEYHFALEGYTDENGEAVFKDLPASHYQVKVDWQNQTDQNELIEQLLLTADLGCEVGPASQDTTIILKRLFFSHLVINEIYYAGTTTHGEAYTSDQFIELYNNSDTTLFLDHLIIARMSKNWDYIGTRYAEVVYAYQFQGSGKDYPIHAGELIVVAQDAIDHRLNADSSIDLSHADFEFFDDQNSDLDNPKVPNLKRLNPYVGGDFMIDSKLDLILLLKPIDEQDFIFNSKGYMLFKVNDVLDGVKYADRYDVDKYIDPQIDAGFAGYGIRRYSYRSIERHNPATGEPGYDTNNSSFDFVNLLHPTPGRQHRADEIMPPG